MPRKRFYSLKEAVAMICEDDVVQQADIVVLPPAQVDELSDCELMDDNDLLTNDMLPDDVAGDVEVQYEAISKLNEDYAPEKKRRRRESKDSKSQCSIRRSSRTSKPSSRFVTDYDIDDEAVSRNDKRHSGSLSAVRSSKNPGDSDNSPADSASGSKVSRSVASRPAASKSKVLKPKVEWKKMKPKFSSQPINNEKQNLSTVIGKLVDKSEVELFGQFFYDEVMNYIIGQSNLYAQQNNRHDFHMELYQLQRFLGFLLFTGYHKLPRENMYWENAEDCSTTIVSSAMSRQTYRDIKRNLHLCDNTALNEADKLFKIRRYTDLLNSKYAQFGVFAHNLSIDEQMVPYFGRHTCKMFMQGKPVRFGFKIWCICSSDGYLFNFIPYAGKNDSLDSELGLGGGVVMQLLSVVSNPLQHAIYFDNFFSSHKLMIKLRDKQFHATGTVREPRLVDSVLQSSKVLNKKERGAYDFSFDRINEVLAVKWHDNAVVTLVSNFQSVQPLLTTKRFCRSERKTVTVSQPNLVASYNSHMGGVDLLDNFVAKYRVAVKGKKWWWPLFVNFIDVSLSNAWLLHRRVHRDMQMDLLEFRRRVTIALLKSQPSNAG